MSRNADAEAVIGRPPFGRMTGVSCSAQSRAREQSAVDPGDVPAGEIGGGHRQLAGGIEPAARRRRLRPHRAQRVAAVADREARPDRQILVDRMHAERLRRCAAGGRRAAAGPRPARRSSRRRHSRCSNIATACRARNRAACLRPAVDDLLRRRRMRHRLEAVILRPIILQARGVAEQLADRDPIAAGDSGHVARDSDRRARAGPGRAASGSRQR